MMPIENSNITNRDDDSFKDNIKVDALSGWSDLEGLNDFPSWSSIIEEYGDQNMVNNLAEGDLQKTENSKASSIQNSESKCQILEDCEKVQDKLVHRVDEEKIKSVAKTELEKKSEKANEIIAKIIAEIMSDNEDEGSETKEMKFITFQQLLECFEVPEEDFKNLHETQAKMLSLAQNCEKAAKSFISAQSSQDSDITRISIESYKIAPENMNSDKKKLSFFKKLNKFFKKFNGVVIKRFQSLIYYIKILFK
ncbi:MAG: hypothetical protein MHMPM18_003801 [Marteilia pararefringens]